MPSPAVVLEKFNERRRKSDGEEDQRVAVKRGDGNAVAGEGEDGECENSLVHTNDEEPSW